MLLLPLHWIWQERNYKNQLCEVKKDFIGVFRMKKLLIDATGSDGWIGGLYYKKNILYSILQNKSITDKFSIIVITDREVDQFNCFSEKVQIIKLRAKYRRVKIFLLCLLMHINYYFPYSTSYSDGECFFKKIGVHIINWIPDFQHRYYPSFFSKEEFNYRDEQYLKLAMDTSDLVLSSADCKKDLSKFYTNKKNVYIVPFVSYIEDRLKIITPEYEKEILMRFGLEKSCYTCVMNQFWQHKNHIVILNAMKLYFQKNPDSDFKFVFTGKLEDYRSPEYIEKIKDLFKEEDIKKHSVLLGFIDRNEQIVIMKNAEYVIQPSLFEGWGTVVEDAKVLDKTILLSDIPVHREQMNEKSILFDPHDAQELADLIEQENNKEHDDDIEAGIADMRAKAKEYSKGFQELLEL